MEKNKETPYDFTYYYGGLNSMDKIQTCVDALIEAIQEGEAYQHYMACEEKLKQQPELREKIDEFRAAVFHLNNDDSGEDLFEKIDHFENKYQEFRKNPLVNEFLEAEVDVCRMLQRITNKIQSSADIQIPQI